LRRFNGVRLPTKAAARLSGILGEIWIAGRDSAILVN
jgi:hypothetical protein